MRFIEIEDDRGVTHEVPRNDERAYFVEVIKVLCDDHAERYGPFPTFQSARAWAEQSAKWAPYEVEFHVRSLRPIPSPSGRGYYGPRAESIQVVNGKQASLREARA